jgi:hypothetical protein
MSSDQRKRQPLPWPIPLGPLLVSAAAWAVALALWWLLA